MTESDGEYDMTPEEIDAFYRRQSRAVRYVSIGFGIFGVLAIVLSLTIPALHLGIWVGVLAGWVGTVLFFINAFRHRA